MIEKLNNESIKNCSGGIYILYNANNGKKISCANNINEVRINLAENKSEENVIVEGPGYCAEFKLMPCYTNGKYKGEAWIQVGSYNPEATMIHCNKVRHPELKGKPLTIK